MKLDVLFSPADFSQLRAADLRESVCVVFDVLRATSSIVTALAHGAAGIWPVLEIADALRIHQERPDVLLAGERDGLRITARESGGMDFHLGNSPREFTKDAVSGKQIVITTTNGTRAMRACDGAQSVLAGSFLNLTATVEQVRAIRCHRVLLVCSGTFEETAFEDVLCAGAFCERFSLRNPQLEMSDSARIALQLGEHNPQRLQSVSVHSRNARRLLSRDALRDDVAFCFQQDAFPIVAHVTGEHSIVRL